MKYRIELTNDEYLNIDDEDYTWLVRNGVLTVSLKENKNVPAFVFSPSCWRVIQGPNTGGVLIHKRGVS